MVIINKMVNYNLSIWLIFILSTMMKSVILLTWSWFHYTTVIYLILSPLKTQKTFKKSEKIRSKSNICKNCGSLFKDFNKDTNDKSTIIRKNKNKKFHTKEWEVRTTAKLFNYSLFSSQENKGIKKRKELSSQNQKLSFRPILFPRKQRNQKQERTLEIQLWI